MTEFVYYSKNAVTSGAMIKENLMEAGRLDIACNVLISAFFLSKDVRKDIKLHMIFDGQPNPGMHLIFEYDKDMPISKKDIGGLIKRMLFKAPRERGKIVKVFPGCSIERKSFEALVKELDETGKNVFLLDEDGEDVREMKIAGNEVFILGDHYGFPPEKKGLLKRIDKISVGPKTLFASHVVTIIHNEMDRRV